jgi:hypothetical protein
MLEQQSAIVIDMAKSLIELLREHVPGWARGYCRFAIDEGVRAVTGSYVSDGKVSLLDVVEYEDFANRIMDLGEKLFPLIGKTSGVLLLSVSSDFNYDVKFEFEDLQRWVISKVGGGTGIPDGL